MDDIKTIIEKIYRDYNPDKISNVPNLLEKYKGKEDELMLKIAEKYSLRMEDYLTIDYLRLVKTILTKYDPVNVSSASTLLATYHGREKELLKTLGDKYNSGFNDLIISTYLKGSPVPDVFPAGDGKASVFQHTEDELHEKPSRKGLGKLKIGIIALTAVIVLIVVLYIGGVFHSNTKTELKSPDTVASKANGISSGASEKSSGAENANGGKVANGAPVGNNVETDKTRAYSTLQAYYVDLMNRNFDATKYFADKVDRFITMRNVTPQVINSYINSSYYKEFVNAKSEIEQEPFVVTKESQDRYSVEYIENGTCYRTSLKKYQHSRVNVKVLLNTEFKIVLMHQYKIIENEYSDTLPQLTPNNTSQPNATQKEKQNSSQISIIFQDNEYSNSISMNSWSVEGSNVYKQDGVMKLEQNVTDHGPILSTNFISINSSEPIRISRKLVVHYANEYYYGHMSLIFNDGISVSIYYLHAAWISGNYIPIKDNIYMFIAPSSELSRYSPPTGGTNSEYKLTYNIWNTWFKEEININPKTSIIQYSINDKLVSEVQTDLNFSSKNSLKVNFSPAGWFTGHYQYFKDFTIMN